MFPLEKWEMIARAEGPVVVSKSLQSLRLRQNDLALITAAYLSYLFFFFLFFLVNAHHVSPGS